MATAEPLRVEAANVVFERRKIDGENGETFKIKPQHPVEELRRAALKAKPPEEKGDFRKPDFVELVRLDDTIKLDIRYATTNNFLSTPFYKSAKAFMQKPAAEALVRVHKKLAEQGYGLLVYDGYRPWSVTKMFWDATPEKLRVFVADPSQGSRHNRGCAVDLTLYERKTGKPVEMVGGYDEMSDRSYADYLGGTSLAALSPRSPAPGDAGGRLHGVRGGMVALRLQGLAEVSDSEQDVRAVGERANGKIRISNITSLTQRRKERKERQKRSRSDPSFFSPLRSCAFA